MIWAQRWKGVLAGERDVAGAGVDDRGLHDRAEDEGPQDRDAEDGAAAGGGEHLAVPDGDGGEDHAGSGEGQQVPEAPLLQAGVCIGEAELPEPELLGL
jgi:hypothetical protein